LKSGFAANYDDYFDKHSSRSTGIVEKIARFPLSAKLHSASVHHEK
jgi:hypothetical protein